MAMNENTRNGNHAAGDVEIQAKIALLAAGMEHPENLPGIVQKTCEGMNASRWLAPIPFSHFTPPSFPVDALPGWLAGYVEAVSRSTQTPPDLCGMLCISVAAAALAKTVIIKPAPGWFEPLNLYVAVFLPPGSRKSAVFRAVSEPIGAYERGENARLAPEITQARAEQDLIKKRLQNAKRRAAKADADPTAADDLRMLSKELEQAKVPAGCKLIVDDCSPEKLAGLLAEHGGRMALLSPEPDLFDMMAGRYSDGKGGLHSVYLKGHAGDDLKVDRVGRPPEHIRHAALTVGLAVQPAVLGGLMAKPGFRGRGLLGRFLYSLPVSNIGYRETSCAPVPYDVEEEYESKMLALLKLKPEQDESGEAISHRLELSPDALRRFNDYREQVETKLQPGQLLADMTDWGAKLAGAVARLAGILSIAEHANHVEPWRTPISRDSMEAAIRLGGYLETHARAAFSQMGARPDIENARYVLDWIKRNELTRFTKREAHHGMQARFEHSADLDSPFSILEERNYIRRQDNQAGNERKAGRQPSPVFIVNPACTQNTQHTQTTPEDNSVCCVGSVQDSEKIDSSLTEWDNRGRRNE